MDDRQHAGSHRLFLLSPLFAMAREQDPHTALGTGDDALRAGRTLPSCCRVKRLSGEEKSSHHRREPARSFRHARVEGGAVHCRARLRGHRPVSPGQGLQQGLRSSRWSPHLSASDAERREQRLRICVGVRLRAVLGVPLHLVDLSAATDFTSFRAAILPTTSFLVALPFKLFGVKYIFDHHDANPGAVPLEVRAERTLFTRCRSGWKS